MTSFVELINTLITQIGRVAKREVLKARIDLHLAKLISCEFLDTQLVLYVVETLAILWTDEVVMVD